MSLWVHLLTTEHPAGSTTFLCLYIINAYSSQRAKVFHIRSLLGMKGSNLMTKELIIFFGVSSWKRLGTFWKTWRICLQSFIQNYPAINILLDSIYLQFHATVHDTGKTTRELNKLSRWLFKLPYQYEKLCSKVKISTSELEGKTKVSGALKHRKIVFWCFNLATLRSWCEPAISKWKLTF